LKKATARRRCGHLANISYRVRREVKFDGRTETFPNDKEANGLLRRSYRKPFVIPDQLL
jgi:hypothetical protein